MAQLGTPDMRLPISLAMTWPNRLQTPAQPLDLLSCPPLTFSAPDEKTFSCLRLAKQAAASGGTDCAVLNGANEAAVGLFLRDRIGFLQIAEAVDHALQCVPQKNADCLETILAADAAARRAVYDKFGK